MAKNNTGNSNPNWPSTTGKPSGSGRGNNPPQTGSNSGRSSNSGGQSGKK